MDGDIIGVALDAQAIFAFAQQIGDAVEGGLRGGLHQGRAALEETHLTQTDDQAVGLATHSDFLALDFPGESSFQLCLQFSQIAILYAAAERAVGP